MSVCGACGKENPDGFQFCGFCGASLVAPVAPSGAKERKTVSVLFCDLVGFTAASESADPEEVQARVAPYHARTRERIEAFGGTVEKFIGDAVMAVFGAPVAHEDDAERAVRAGLAILDAIAGLNAADETLALSVRIGVNTGEAVVSLDARPELGEGMVTGDVVNTAARIQSAGPIDAVAVGVGTFQATERVFEYEPLEPVSAKGKTEPVPVWRALAPRARFGSDVIRTLTTPLVGRETDLALLTGLFDKVAREQEVQLVTVVGEPGVGKSRLVAELGAYVDALPDLVTWRQGRCLPYGDGITFWALGEIVKAHAGIYESDSAEDAAAKLELLLPEGDERPWFRARLLPLLGIEAGQPPSREESFTAWRRFLEQIAENGPFALVVEDVHWADEALLAFLEHFADWARGVPALVVCTARPELYERHPSWGAGLANQTAIRLGPLSDVETARLVSALLEQAALPVETQQLLLERAGGNPLYAEEFVRMLRDRGLLDERGVLRDDADFPFPDTIQALIAARLDTLSTERKRLLQDAAVMGKVFWSGSVAAMGDRDPREVEVALHELSRKELVRPSRQSSMEGEAEYGFWHLLVRDVAYAQIPRAERAARHLRAADWLEAKAGERVEDLAEVLAYHTGEALELARATGDAALAEDTAPRAARFAFLAGERAAALDVGKALQFLDRALELTPEDDPALAEILLRWGEVARDAGRFADAVAAVDRAIELARDQGDVELLARALLGISEDPLEGLARGREAVKLLEPLPACTILVEALASVGFSLLLAGELGNGEAVAHRAIALAEELGLPPPPRAISTRASVRTMAGDPGSLADWRLVVDLEVAAGGGGKAIAAYNNLGVDTLLTAGPLRGLAVYDEGIAFAQPRGLVTSLIEANRIGLLLLAGRLAEAEALADELVPVAREQGHRVNRFQVEVFRACVDAEAGRFDSETAERLLEEARTFGIVEYFVNAVAAAARARLASGDAAGATELLRELAGRDGLDTSTEYAWLLPALVRCALAAGDDALARELVSRAVPLVPIARRSIASSRALLAEASREYAEAASLFADAASGWEEFGAALEQAYALLGRGRCLAMLGDPSADQPLREAHALFADMGRGPAWRSAMR